MATKLKILVVEDHDDLRDITVDILNLQGHQAMGLPSAESLAESHCQEKGELITGLDLLIVDLNLPGEDGLSLAKRFRAAQPGLGIIMVTARHEAADKVRGYESGADIYLPKPVSAEELVAAVNALARRLGQTSQSESGNLSLRLDTQGMCLHGPQDKVDLSHRECNLLVALTRAPGQRLEYWQLLELFGLGLDEQDKTNLEIRIVRLRKKMTAVGADKGCIRSIRLHGYQLCLAISIA